MEGFENELDQRLFGIRLEKARHEQHITRDKLADLCNITTVHVRHMEGGTRLPSLPVFISLCNALKVSPTYFLGDYLNLTDGLPDAYQKVLEILMKAPPRQAELIIAMIETMNRHLEE